MCGRFSLDTFPKSIIDAFDVGDIEFNPLLQVYPTNQVDVVFRSENSNEIASMAWSWKRSFSNKPLINVRSQEAWEKRTWAQAIRERRCIIPTSGFFEWDENQPKGKRDRYRINPSTDDGFAFGGVYEINAETGEMAMAILTTLPNNKMSKIHHRMPVLLDKEKYDDWFVEKDRAYIDHLMKPANNSVIDLVKET